MVRALQSIISLILGTEFITGILGNGFIVLVNCIEWVKIRKISSVDRILTALVISRICLLLVMMVSWTAKEFDPFVLRSRKKALLFSICVAVANHFSTWLATSLSLFYFLKIANFSNPVFLYLKRRVDIVVLVMLLGASVFLPFSFTVISPYIQIHLHEGNITWNSKRSDPETFLKLTILTMGTLIPFSVSLIFFFLLIFSLWKHLKNMRLNITRSGDASTKAHVRAMKTVISFPLLFAVYFLCLLTAMYPNVRQNELVFMFCKVFAIVFPSLHSFILIMGNSKLRKASLLVLRQLRCC